MRKCVKCGIEKELSLFRKKDKWFKHTCKECCNAPLRTGKVHTGRFKKGHSVSLLTQFKKGQAAWNKGKKATKEEIEKIKKACKKRKSAKPRGGRTRNTVFYRKWRKTVLERDFNKCVRCSSEEKLDAHHIVPWAQNENLRLEVSNGETLCKSCHMAHEFTERQKKGLSTEFKKGSIPWNKGLKKCH